MNAIQTPVAESGDTFRPLLLSERIDDVATTRDALQQVDRSRSDIFEVRNLLQAEAHSLIKSQEGMGPILSLEHCELQRANEAALKAAEDVVKAQATLHRNLMTLLGFRTHHEVTHP